MHNPSKGKVNQTNLMPSSWNTCSLIQVVIFALIGYCYRCKQATYIPWQSADAKFENACLPPGGPVGTCDWSGSWPHTFHQVGWGPTTQLRMPINSTWKRINIARSRVVILRIPARLQPHTCHMPSGGLQLMRSIWWGPSSMLLVGCSHPQASSKHLTWASSKHLILAWATPDF